MGQTIYYVIIFFFNQIAGKLPVIFSIHGGAFKVGAASGPGEVRAFMDEDVVIVAPNYRLGTMGMGINKFESYNIFFFYPYPPHMAYRVLNGNNQNFSTT